MYGKSPSQLHPDTAPCHRMTSFGDGCLAQQLSQNLRPTACGPDFCWLLEREAVDAACLSLEGVQMVETW